VIPHGERSERRGERKQQEELEYTKETKDDTGTSSREERVG
jgi:hypothetical protein